MKRIGKKGIGILIIIVFIAILGIKLLTNSKADKLIEITATIIDKSGLIDDEEYQIQAINEEESGYCITLPSVINEKVINQYYIPEKKLNSEIQEEQENQEEENINEEEKVSETLSS